MLRSAMWSTDYATPECLHTLRLGTSPARLCAPLTVENSGRTFISVLPRPSLRAGHSTFACEPVDHNQGKPVGNRSAMLRLTFNRYYRGPGFLCQLLGANALKDVYITSTCELSARPFRRCSPGVKPSTRLNATPTVPPACTILASVIPMNPKIKRR
jgi:hypothetical protein